jgi:hypothetical protein
MTEPGRLLDIYLRDHRAGAMAGRRLAKRVARENPESQWAPLQTIVREIEEDETSLDITMRMLGVSEAVLKSLAAVAIEKVGQLKPNGRLLGYSPLSRVVELESLMSGIIAKCRLWVSLRQFARDANRSLPGIDFEELAARAAEQLTTLASLHEKAARIAFSAEEEGSFEPDSIPHAGDR